MREVIVTGKTVEEATEKACLELGLPREEVPAYIRKTWPKWPLF